MKLSVKEYMKSRNISRRTVYNRIEREQITVVKENHKIFIIEENLANNAPSKSKRFTTSKSRINDLLEKLEDISFDFYIERMGSIEKGIITLLSESSKNDGAFDKNFNNLTESLEIFGNRLNDYGKIFDNIFDSINSIKKSQEEMYNKINNIENKVTTILEKQEKKKSISLFKK